MLQHQLDWPICSLTTIIDEPLLNADKYLFKKSWWLLVLQKALSDSWSACHDGSLTMLSPGVSSLLFTFAFQTIERQRKQCNLSKRKRLRSIGFSLQLCFHTAVEAGCRALMNDTLTFPSPLPSCVSPRLLSPVTAMMRERRDEFVHRDLILLNATSPVNSCQFCHCRFQAVSWLCSGGGDTRRHDLSESCTLLNYPSLCSPTWRGGVKQLTCGPEKYVTAVFIVQQEIELPS